MTEILVLYYSRHGARPNWRDRSSAASSRFPAPAPRLRTVPAGLDRDRATEPAVPGSGPPYATHDDLRACDGLVLGSPTRFGNMAAPLKYFLDGTSALWLNGGLDRKPAGVFTSTSTLHGGQESTLLTMMLPLLHHGMYSWACLSRPGDAPHAHRRLALRRQPLGAPSGGGARLSEDERELARLLGRRVAELAVVVRSRQP